MSEVNIATNNTYVTYKVIEPHKLRYLPLDMHEPLGLYEPLGFDDLSELHEQFDLYEVESLCELIDQGYSEKFNDTLDLYTPFDSIESLELLEPPDNRSLKQRYLEEGLLGDSDDCNTANSSLTSDPLVNEILESTLTLPPCNEKLPTINPTTNQERRYLSPEELAIWEIMVVTLHPIEQVIQHQETHRSTESSVEPLYDWQIPEEAKASPNGKSQPVDPSGRNKDTPHSTCLTRTGDVLRKIPLKRRTLKDLKRHILDREIEDLLVREHRPQEQHDARASTPASESNTPKSTIVTLPRKKPKQRNYQALWGNIVKSDLEDIALPEHSPHGSDAARASALFKCFPKLRLSALADPSIELWKFRSEKYDEIATENYDYVIHVTPSRRVTQLELSKAFNSLIFRINRRLFGSDWHKKEVFLRGVVSAERSSKASAFDLHFHCLITIPEEYGGKLSLASLQAKIKAATKSLAKDSKPKRPIFSDNSIRVEPIDSIERLASYITKELTERKGAAADLLYPLEPKGIDWVA